MKSNLLLCLLSALLCINLSSAAFIRVINAVPESQGLDVWVLTQSQSQSNQTQGLTPEPAIRLFQNITYGDIPPYFFITDKSTPWVFLFSDATRENALTSEQVSTLQRFTSPLQANNNYTLVVASTGSDQSNFQYLLVTDRLTGQEQGAEGGNNVFVRLVNVGAQQPVTLIAGGTCPTTTAQSRSGVAQMRVGEVSGIITRSYQPMQTQTQSAASSYAGGAAGTLESQTQSAQPTQSESQSSQATQSAQPTQETQAFPSAPSETQQPSQQPQPQPTGSNILAVVPFLRAGPYVALPQNIDRERDLQLCVGGEAQPVYLAASYRGDSNLYSVFVFQRNSASEDAVLKRERLMREEAGLVEPGMEGQQEGQPEQGEGSQTGTGAQQGQGNGQGNQQGGSQSQNSGFIGFITDDIPLDVTNSRLRVIHAGAQLPAIDVFLDGNLLFNSVNFSVVTNYQRTWRGLHNITIVPSQGSQGQNQSLGVQFPYSFFTFLAWDRFYTMAVLPTGVLMMQGENQQAQSEDNLQPTRESGFVGPLHKIFLDDFAASAPIRRDSAFIQVVHLAPSAGAALVNFTGSQRLVLPLENTFYYPIQASNQVIALTLLRSGSEGQGSQGQAGQGSQPLLVQQQLQPNTLYSLFVLEGQNNQVTTLLVRDRSVLITCRAVNV